MGKSTTLCSLSPGGLFDESVHNEIHCHVISDKKKQQCGTRNREPALRVVRVGITDLNRKRVFVNPLRTLKLVEVTGFEPAASWSRTVKALYNKGFRVIFSAFVSEIGAFQGYPTHCVHTVQVRRWSKVWSEQIFTRTRAPNRESSSSFFLPIV